MVFTFSHSLAIAQDPGSYIRQQLPQEVRGPVAVFEWASSDLTVTFSEMSRSGDASIASYRWDLGDGTRTSEQSPPSHAYASPGVYQATLLVTDQNGKESVAYGQLDLATGATRSGRSVTNPAEGAGLDPVAIAMPIAVGLLGFLMYLVLAVIGGHFLRAGWNIVKPKPETIKVRLKPRHLTEALEADTSMQPPPPDAR